MKKKRWIVFRVAVYLCMALALLMTIAIFSFILINAGPFSIKDWFSFFLFLLLPSAQFVFQAINIRMLQFFLPNNLMPGNAFKRWQTLFLVLETICIMLFSFLLVDVINDLEYSKTVESGSFIFWLKFTIAIVSSNIIINLYTIIASLQLRSYLHFNQKATEEALLDSLGKESDAS